jgi:inosine/xanthosine triphosphate pyrophosphatase family protein
MPVDKGLTVTFAEMTSEDKNAISHRGRAIEKLAKFFLS